MCVLGSWLFEHLSRRDDENAHINIYSIHTLFPNTEDGPQNRVSGDPFLVLTVVVDDPEVITELKAGDCLGVAQLADFLVLPPLLGLLSAGLLTGSFSTTVVHSISLFVD